MPHDAWVFLWGLSLGLFLAWFQKRFQRALEAALLREIVDGIRPRTAGKAKREAEEENRRFLEEYGS